MEQEGPVLRVCLFHKVPVCFVCLRCCVPVCKKCKEHKKHPKVPLDAYLATTVKEIPRNEELKAMLPAITTAIEDNKVTKDGMEKDVKEQEMEFLRVSKLVSNVKTLQGPHTQLVRQIVDYIDNVKGNITARWLFAEVNDMEDDIKDELSIKLTGRLLKKDAKEEKKYLDLARITLSPYLFDEVYLKLALEAAQTGTLSADAEYALAMLKLHGVLYYGDRGQHTVMDYTAFPGVQISFPIDEASRKFGMGISGCKIHTAYPIEINDEGDKLQDAAWVSPRGVLVRMGYQGKVEFLHMIKNKSFFTTVKSDTEFVFFDDKMLLVVRGELMRETSVEGIFDAWTPEAYPQVGQMKVRALGDTSATHGRRTFCHTVYLDSGSYGGIYEYNVDTHTHTKLPIDPGYDLGGSIFGIANGCKTIVTNSSGAQETIFAVDMRDRVERINSMEGNYFQCLFVSHKNPANLKEAFIQGSRGYKRRGWDISFEGPVKLSRPRTIVRLAQDVFLCFDTERYIWALVRLEVN